MDELIKKVSDKIGVDEEQAKQAVNTVLEFLEDKLPEPIAGQIRKFAGGGGDGDGGGEGGGGLMDQAKGLFGG